MVKLSSGRLRSWKAFLVLIASCLVAFGLVACGGSDSDDSGSDDTEVVAESSDGGFEPIELTFAGFIGENTSTGQIAKRWMEEVTERTDGNVTFVEHWDASLVPPDEVPQALKDGRADVAVMTTGYHPDDFPLTTHAAHPFNTTNLPAFSEVLTQLSTEDGEYKDEWTTNQLMPLGLFGTPGAVLGTKEPISSFDDIKGQRIRALPNHVPLLEEVGAAPVAMDVGDIYEALQRGVLDGYYSITLDFVESLALYEVAQSLADPATGIFTVMYIAMGDSRWNELPANVQEVMSEVALEVPAIATQTFGEFEDQACETVVIEGGVEISELPEEELASLQETTEAQQDFGEDQAFVDDLTERIDTLAEEEFSDFQGGLQRCSERIADGS